MDDIEDIAVTELEISQRSSVASATVMRRQTTKNFEGDDISSLPLNKR